VNLKKKLERYLRVNLLGPGPRLIKNNLQDRGLTKVEKHWVRGFTDISHISDSLTRYAEY